jgi:Domain of unknown function (DUF6089)
VKFIIFIFFLVANICKAQESLLKEHLKIEFMGGVSGYNGDLSEHRITMNQLRPAFNVNLKYNTEDFINFGIGFGYGRVGGNDKFNTRRGLKARNLNFKTNIFEANIIGEIKLADPQYYDTYPYLFFGIGVFHFNPFTYDSSGIKTFLQPLGTEGQGLQEYPDRKPYKRTQLCIPIGGGWKWNFKDVWELSYEIGARILFTDYLDDVSKTYPNLQALAIAKGEKAVELTYRGTAPFVESKQRGNPSNNDFYFYSGIKVAVYIRQIQIRVRIVNP